MENLEKYNKIFEDVLNIQTNDFEGDIEAESIKEWDSISHLKLITNIEDEFDVMFETEDILDFKSYNKGKDILKKYDIEI